AKIFANSHPPPGSGERRRHRARRRVPGEEAIGKSCGAGIGNGSGDLVAQVPLVTGMSGSVASLRAGTGVFHVESERVMRLTVGLRRMLAMAVIAMACSEGVTNPPPAVATVLVSPGTATIESGGTLQLNVQLRDAEGNPITDRE